MYQDSHKAALRVRRAAQNHQLVVVHMYTYINVIYNIICICVMYTYKSRFSPDCAFEGLLKPIKSL